YCGLGTWSAPVTVKVSNHQPAAHSESASVVRNSSVKIPVLANDTDPDEDPIQLAVDTIIVAPVHGTAVKNDDGTITYVSPAGWTGTDSFRYRIVDSYGAVDSAVVTVTVHK